MSIRRLARVALIAVAAFVAVVLLGLFVLQTPWARNQLRQLAERQAERATGADVTIGALGGNLLTRAELQGVRIAREGRPVAAIPGIEVGYSIPDLLTGAIDIASLHLHRPTLHIRRTKAGAINVAALGGARPARPSDADAQPPVPESTRGVGDVPPTEGLTGDAGRVAGRGWSIGEIVIQDGTLTIADEVVATDAVRAPDRVVDLDGDLSVRSRPEGGVVLGIDALSFHATSPPLIVRQAEGQVTIGPEVVRFDELSLRTGAGTIAIDGSIRRPAAATGDDSRDRIVSTLDVRITATDLQLAQLAPIVPALEGYQLSPTLKAILHGPLSRLAASFQVDTAAGAIGGDVTLDVVAPVRTVRGTVRTRDLDLAGLRQGNGEQTNITLETTVDLQLGRSGMSSLSGTYDVDAPEFQYGPYRARNVEASGRVEGRRIHVKATAEIYGGTAQTSGTITLPSGNDPISYDLDGRLRNIDPSQLPPDLRPPGASRRGASMDGPRPVAARNALRTVGYMPATARVVPASSVRNTAPVARGASPAQRGHGRIDLDFSIEGRGSEVDAEVRLRDFSFAGAEFSEDTLVNVSNEGGRLRYSVQGLVRGLDLRRLGRELEIEPLTADRYAGEITARLDITGAGTDLKTLTLHGTAQLSDVKLLGATIPAMTVRPDLKRGAGTIGVDGRFAQLDLAALTGNPSLESELQGSIDARVRLESLADPAFALGSLEAGGRLTLADSEISGVTIRQAVVAASASENLLRVQEMAVEGPSLTVEASGVLALDDTRSSDLRYFIDTPALQRIDVVDAPLTGDLQLEGGVTGSLARLVVDGTLSGTQVGYRDMSARSIQSDYELTVPDLSPTRMRVHATTELAGVEAAGRSFTSLTARADYAARALEFDATLEDATRSMSAGGRLLWHPDHQELRLRRVGLQTPDAQWRLAGSAEPVIEYRGDVLVIRDLGLATDTGGRVAIKGAFGAPERTLRASVADLRLDHVDDFMLAENGLAGVLTLEAEITGTLARPTVDATFAVENGAYRGFEYRRAGGTVQYTPSLLRLDVRLDQSDATSLTARGVVPLSSDTREPLQLMVQSTPVDLGLVEALTDEVQDVTGTAEIDLRVLGTPSHPTFDGSLHVRNGAFTVTVAQSRYSGFDTDVTFEPDVASIREFHVTDDEGHRLRIGGQLALHGGTVGDVQIQVQSDNFEMADNRLAELNVDTDLQVTGEIMRPRVSGRVALRESTIHVDRILQATRGAYQVTPAGDRTASGVGLFAPTIDIDLAIPETLVIRGTDLRSPAGGRIGLGDVSITIGGSLALEKAPGADLVLTGELQTVRGTYEFQGREFEIERDGRVVFMGTPDINPRLDVRARRAISGVVATVHIGGVLDQPELQLSSQPPMENAEILSLIVFNQPLSLLGTGEQISLATRATALASGFVASALAESLGEALELDVLDIEAATADGSLSPVVTVGEQFGQLFVRLRQRFGPEAVSQAVLEYRLADWVRLETSYAQGDTYVRNLLQRVEAGGIDLLFFFSY
jgi:hypothetical protein